MSAIPRRVAALVAPFALAACLTAASPTDPKIAEAARAFQDQAARIHAALAIEAAPQCAYEQNKNYYDELRASAAEIEASIDVRAAPMLVRAGKALTWLVEDARASHRAASAQTGDTHGPCMAPGAIALNAGALDRAASAIAVSQAPAGDQQ